MELKKIVDELGLEVRAGGDRLNVEVSGGYVSDLLSDVIANSNKGDLWLTLQVHKNIVAVATLKELAGIVIIGGKEPSEDTVAKSEEESVVLLRSNLTAFELAGRLFGMGVGRKG